MIQLSRALFLSFFLPIKKSAINIHLSSTEWEFTHWMMQLWTHERKINSADQLWALKSCLIGKVKWKQKWKTWRRCERSQQVDCRTLFMKDIENNRERESERGVSSVKLLWQCDSSSGGKAALAKRKHPSTTSPWVLS